MKSITEIFRKIVRIFMFVRFFYKANVIPYLFTECPSIIIIDMDVFVNFAYASLFLPRQEYVGTGYF